MEVVTTNNTVDEDWNAFIFNTCNQKHLESARKGMHWQQVQDYLYQSNNGSQHLCEPSSCNSWVIRHKDGVKICAISGRCILTRAMGLVSPPMDPRRKAMKRREIEEDEEFCAQSPSKMHQNR